MLLPSLVAFAMSGQMVSGQRVLWTHTGTQGSSMIYVHSAVIGDVDGDGWRDAVHSVEVYYPSPPRYEWQIWTFSGRDGRRLRARTVEPSYWYYCRAVGTVGDLDGDGCADYTITWVHKLGTGPTYVDVRSGRTEALLWQVTNTWVSLFGFCVAGIGDVDGDGRADVGVTAPRESAFGTVFVYSSTGTLLHRIVGTQAAGFIGQGWQTLGAVGDVDRDGRDDFVVGGGSFNDGAAFVLSGRTGQILVAGFDTQPGDNLGATVDGCGDMDGDGTPDFVVGSTGGISTPGLVTVFSGRTGQALRTWRAADIGRPFEANSLRSGGMDADLDGVPDVLVGTGNSLWVLSGRDGSVIIRSEDQGANFAAHTSIVGPQPGSPYPHFIVTQSRYGNVTPPPFSYLGRILGFDSAPAGVQTYGRACAGSLASTPTIGLRHLNATTVRVTVHGAAPNAPAVLLLGGSRSQWGPLPLPFALGAIGLPQCDLFTAADLLLPVATGSAGTATGYAALGLPVRLDGAGPITLHAQWWCLPPAGLPGGVSNAVRWNAWL